MLENKIFEDGIAHSSKENNIPKRIVIQVEKQLQRAAKRGVLSPNFKNIASEYIPYAKERWKVIRAGIPDAEFYKRRIKDEIYNCNSKGKDFYPTKYQYSDELFKFAKEQWENANKLSDEEKLEKQMNVLIRDLISRGEEIQDIHLAGYEEKDQEKLLEKWEENRKRINEKKFKENHVKAMINSAISEGTTTVPDLSNYSNEIEEFGKTYWDEKISRKTPSEMKILKQKAKISQGKKRGTIRNFKISDKLNEADKKIVVDHFNKVKESLTDEEINRRKIDERIKGALKEGQETVPDFLEFSEEEQNLARAKFKEELAKISQEELLKRKITQRMRGNKTDGAKTPLSGLKRKNPVVKEKFDEFNKKWKEITSEQTEEDRLEKKAKRQLQRAINSGQSTIPDVSSYSEHTQSEIKKQWHQHLEQIDPKIVKKRRLEITIGQQLRRGNLNELSMEGVDEATKKELLHKWNNKKSKLTSSEIRKRKIDTRIENALNRGQKKKPFFSDFNKEERQYADRKWKEEKENVPNDVLEKRYVRQAISSNVAAGAAQPLSKVVERKDDKWNKKWDPYITEVWEEKTKDRTEAERQKNVAKARVYQALFHSKPPFFQDLGKEAQQLGEEFYQRKIHIRLQTEDSTASVVYTDDDELNELENDYVDFDKIKSAFFYPIEQDNLEKACRELRCGLVEKLLVNSRVDFNKDITDYFTLVLNARGAANDKRKIIALLLEHSYPIERIPSETFLICIFKRNIKLAEFIADKIQPGEKLYQLLTYSSQQNGLPIEVAIKQGNREAIIFILSTFQKCGKIDPRFFEIDINLPSFLSTLVSIPKGKERSIYDVLDEHSFFNSEFIESALKYWKGISFSSEIQESVKIWKSFFEKSVCSIKTLAF